MSRKRLIKLLKDKNPKLNQLEIEKKSSSTLKEPQNVHMKGKDASVNHKNISKYMEIFFILKYLIIFLNKNPSMFVLKLATIKYLHPRLLKLSSKQLRKVGEFHLQDH